VQRILRIWSDCGVVGRDHDRAPRYCTSITTSAGPRTYPRVIPTQTESGVRWNRPRRDLTLNMYRFSVQCIGYGRDEPDDTRYRRQWMAWKVDVGWTPIHKVRNGGSQTVVCVPSGRNWRTCGERTHRSRLPASVKLRVRLARTEPVQDDRRWQPSSGGGTRFHHVVPCAVHEYRIEDDDDLEWQSAPTTLNTIESLDATEDRCSPWS
jgi:hypothetical protein